MVLSEGLSVLYITSQILACLAWSKVQLAHVNTTWFLNLCVRFEDKCNLIGFHLISLSLAIMFSWQCNHGNKERPRPSVSDENGDGKRIFSKTLVRVESFESASFSFTRGRTKTELMSNIMYFLRDSSSVRDAVVFPSFQRFRVDWRTSPFSKISTYVWSGPKSW